MNLPAAKTPHYLNNLILAKDGTPLSTVNDKRMKWYLDRGLANRVKYHDKRYPKVIQLNFENKKSIKNNDSAIEVMENRCVVCGCADGLSLHHVVPHRIKKFYPHREKDFTPHLCVLLCEPHHVAIERINDTLFLEPEKEFNEFRKKVLKPINIFLDKLRKLYTIWWIKKSGGVKNINRIFIETFKKQNPKYLPKNWLHNE